MIKRVDFEAARMRKRRAIQKLNNLAKEKGSEYRDAVHHCIIAIELFMVGITSKDLK